MKDVQLFIDGIWRDAQAGETIFRFSQSSAPRPWCAGIGPAFAAIGAAPLFFFGV